jgi:putative membrane protein
MKNKIIVISMGVVVLALMGPASNAAQNPPAKNGGGKLSAKDKRFMNEAAKGGMMEVEWGKLAAQNGQHPEVKKFGNRMVTDHSKANDELTALAKKEGVQLPAAKSSGKRKSDKDYIDMMVKDHEKDLAAFQAEAKDGTDSDLKKFADKTSKMVENHLQMAKEIQGKLK